MRQIGPEGYTRADVLNQLIETHGYGRYLEIGVQMRSMNFDFIECPHKVAVDPDPENPDGIQFLLTSDQFFAQNTDQFDLIFLDGMHTEDQVDKDILNALAALKPGGSVVLHDCLPPTEWHQRSMENYPRQECWNGTVWKSALKFFAYCRFDCYVVEADWGCGVINTRRPPRFLPPTFTLPLDYNKDYSKLKSFVISQADFALMRR